MNCMLELLLPLLLLPKSRESVGNQASQVAHLKSKKGMKVTVVTVVTLLLPLL